ncbi:phage tail length tape measure family protein [Brevundimonas sp. LjRoot202]|uniref:phage tail length tape measure family protein n=1 Tax=Brevundimonas sp. LjRoot202 TaxID=3342281 RepID=UPI003ED0BA21
MKAETATEKLAAAARGNGAAMMTMNTAMRQQRRALDAVRGATGLTSHETLNLGRQFADVGVSLASGQAIWMVAIQQGAQIGEVFAEARNRGIGLSAALQSLRATAVSTGAAVWTALAPLLPIIAAIAAAAGTVAIGWGLATRSLRNDIGDLTDGMNLTEAQMKRLKEEGVSTSVTAGDAFRGLGTTIKEVLVENFGTQIDWMTNAWTTAMDFLTEVGSIAVAGIGAAFVGTYRAIINTWQRMPAALGDIAIQVVNGVAKGLDWIVQKSVGAINDLIGGVRFLAAINPSFAWARGLGDISAGRIGGMDNPYAGSAAALDRTNAAGYVDAYRDVRSGLAAGMDRWRENTAASGRARVRAAAGEADTDGGGRAARNARAAREELTRIAAIDFAPLTTRMEHLVDPLQIIADELRLIDDLAKDTAQGLASAFGESGRALGDLLTAMSGYQSRLAEIDLAEREYRLNAVQADRERAQAQMQNYGDMASAARGFFAEGSDGYRVLLAIEQAYRLQQMMGMVQAMAMGQTETASSVANSAARGAASMAAGAAKMFEALGPWAFPAVAAMIGLLAGLGLRGGGGGSRGASTAATTDNAPEATTAAVRAQSAVQGQAQSAALSGMARTIDVRVTADKDGIHAYIAGTARKEAVGVAIPLAAATAAGTKRDTLATLSDQQAGNRRITS